MSINDWELQYLVIFESLIIHLGESVEQGVSVALISLLNMLWRFIFCGP